MSSRLRSRKASGHPSPPKPSSSSSRAVDRFHDRDDEEEGRRSSGKDKSFFPPWMLLVVFACLGAVGWTFARGIDRRNGAGAFSRERTTGKGATAAASADRSGRDPPRRATKTGGTSAGAGGGGSTAAAGAKVGGGGGKTAVAAAKGTDGGPSNAGEIFDPDVIFPTDDPHNLSDATGTNLHVVFSTDCGTFQHWQSYLLFYSALRVGQPGTVTRIASGCSDAEGAEARAWFDAHVKSMSPRFKLHLTPHFSKVKDEKGEETGKDYKFFNKPFGLKHWMENGDGMGVDLNTGKAKDEDAVVILIDPDMTFLRPITSEFGSDYDASPRKVLVGKEGLSSRRVAHGSPFGQTYGLGTGWMKFDLDEIAGSDSPAKAVTREDAALHYPVGPPYIATARDMLSIATDWAGFAPRVHAQYPYLLAEMYAYCIAAAHLKLPHQRISSLMVSGSGLNAEGWGLLGDMNAEEACDFARTLPHPTDQSKYPVPSVLHLCQRYIVGPWLFAKRKVPHDFFTCEQSLFEEPPPNLGTYNHKIKPHEKTKEDLSKMEARDHTFIICVATNYMNEAGKYYKSRHCREGGGEGKANWKKTINLFAMS